MRCYNLEWNNKLTSVKGYSNWAGVTLVDGNYPAEENNFALAFKSKIINDLTKFSLELLDGKQQKIKFDDSE